MPIFKHDINWDDSLAGPNAVVAVYQAFQGDPMMQLFSEDALYRLADFVVGELKKYSPSSMYAVYNIVTYKIMRRSVYYAFGTPLFDKVADIVSSALYPETWAQDS